MPFDTGEQGGDLQPTGTTRTVTLTTPGLYVFFCDIHVYMFAAVIVDDPATVGLDLGKTVDLPTVTATGITGLPTASNLALRLVHTFFIVTDPHNWQHYPATGTTSWSPSYPPVPVLAGDAHGNPVPVADLNAFLGSYFSEPKTLDASLSTPPSHPGVGEVWVNTQFEKMAHDKTKPGTATAVDAATWLVTKKFGLPSIDLNNPHNMWTDRNQTVIYQTQWFDTKLAVFDRKSGVPLQNIHVGYSPAHVMTRTNNDYVHVSLNGGNDVVELTPQATAVVQNISMGDPSIVGDHHPHAHWMSADGNMMVTPNEATDDSTLFNFKNYQIETITSVGHTPIATGMMPDSSKYYVANFLDNTISVIGIHGAGSHNPSAFSKGTINLIANYDPIAGGVVADPKTKVTFVGALPIQTPVSPDGKYMITANTLTATITVVDTATDTVVAMLPCDPGCHGVQFGAKKGGGYYVYVSSKFSNRLTVVDPDPNGAGVAPDNGSNAVIAGHVLLTTANAVPSNFKTDGTVTEYAGMGGQGVLPIPVVYNGWVQHLPEEWKEKLTYQQRHPFPEYDGDGDHK